MALRMVKGEDRTNLTKDQYCKVHRDLLNTGCKDCMNIIEKIAETCQMCGNKWSLTCH